MSHRIEASVVYPDHKFLLDFIARRKTALAFFEQDPGAFERAAEVRSAQGYPRSEICKALRTYNQRLSASARTMANIDALRDDSTLCVVAGQQAGFLGGPAYTAYKILSAVRLSSWLQEQIGARVVPIFWLATEDHDVDEIRRVRLLEIDGRLRTISFDCGDRGRPIEDLPLTSEIRQAAGQVLDAFPSSLRRVRELFLPEDEDDYGTWHARIWSRLFAGDGLILVEPRTLRHLAGGFFRSALESANEIVHRLEQTAAALRTNGYDPPLDPRRAGRLFLLDAGGNRVRIATPAAHIESASRSPTHYSTDAALRPILADTLLPSLANVLGPAETAYQAMLLPLYQLFGVPQAVPVPRHGYTLLSATEAGILERLNVPVEEAVAPDFTAGAALQKIASPELRAAFSEAREAVRQALTPLLPLLEALDPGLDARWRQTADRAAREVDQLEGRAVRVDLARRSISVQAVRVLEASLHPTGRLQERALSLIHFVRRFGVEWIPQLPGSENPASFAHHVVTVSGET